jgi:plasmid stabilization system protein ParE
VTRYRVIVTQRAEDQIRSISAWWRANRLSAPELFNEEFTTAVERLTTSPLSGTPYAVAQPPGIRRVLLRRSGYHVYYTIESHLKLVAVRAVWHAARGHGPGLR